MGHATETRWLRSGAQKIEPARIDAEAGIIYDVVMVQEGPAKGHGVHLDADFIEAITAYDNRHLKKSGLKARFGHPTASGETMGTQLGVFYDFRTRKGPAGRMEEIANLHLLESADESPTHPGMRSWVLKMAQERPDFLMSSIVFAPSGYFQMVNGKKMPVYTYDKDGDWIDPVRGEDIYVEFNEKNGARHYYTDIVEQGAATDRLFSHGVNQHLFAVQAENFMQEHPEILEFVKNNPDAVAAWMQRAGYTITATQDKGMFSFADWLKGGNTAPGPEELKELRDGLHEAQQQFTQAQAQITSLTQERDAAVAALSAAQTAQNDVAAQVTQLQQQVTDLTTQLAKAPADVPTGGPAGGNAVGAAPDRAYKANPLNARIYNKK